MATVVTIEIPTEILHAARMTAEDLRRELALSLYQQGKLSFGKARELADMTAWAFQQLLGSRDIPIHYGLQEYDQDLKTLQELGL